MSSADHGIDQERHIVVDDFKHRHAARRGSRLEADLGRAGLALGEERPRLLGDAGELFGGVALRDPPAPQGRTVWRGNLRECRGSRFASSGRGGIDQRHAGIRHRRGGECPGRSCSPLDSSSDITRFAVAQPPLPRGSRDKSPDIVDFAADCSGDNGKQMTIAEHHHGQAQQKAAAPAKKTSGRARRQATTPTITALTLPAGAAHRRHGGLFRQMRGKARLRAECAQGLCFRHGEARRPLSPCTTT